MAISSKGKPGGRAKPAAKRPKPGHEAQATTEEFRREGMGVAAKE